MFVQYDFSGPYFSSKQFDTEINLVCYKLVGFVSPVFVLGGPSPTSVCARTVTLYLKLGVRPVIVAVVVSNPAIYTHRTTLFHFKIKMIQGENAVLLTTVQI